MSANYFKVIFKTLDFTGFSSFIKLILAFTVPFFQVFISSLASNNTKKQSILNVKDCFISYFLLLCVYI